MKRPAFQFYPQDFLVGTAMFSQEEVGAYIRLLAFQWEHNGLPEKLSMLMNLAGGEVSELVLSKFPVWEDGRRRNLKLEQIRQEQIEYSKKQSVKGKRGGNPAFEKGNPNPYYQDDIQMDNPKDNPRDNPRDNPKDNPKDNPEITQKITQDINPSPSPSPSPSSSSSSSIKTAVAPQQAPLHELMIKTYTDWYESPQIMGLEYKFAGAKDGTAVKQIIAYLKKAVMSRTNLPATDEQVIEFWKFILSKYEKWDKWYRSKLDLAQLNTNLNGILISIKGLGNGKSLRSRIDDIDAKVNEVYAEQGVDRPFDG